MDISIVVPTYNRKQNLKECLDSILSQECYPYSFEVVVVDDGSADGTGEVIRELSERYENVRYYYQLSKGPAAARNLGLMNVKADIVAFTDSDCILGHSWIRNMIQAHMSYPEAAVIGGATKVDARNIKSAVSQSLSEGAMAVDLYGKKEVIFFPTCNVSVKKKFLIEKFDESFVFPAGEDLDLFWRLFKKERRFVYKHDIEVFHNCHPDLSSFLRQAYLYGRGNYLVQCIHKDHPLLKEIKTRSSLSFIFGTIINFLKIPRFAYLMGKRLIQSHQNFNWFERCHIYVYFVLHKIMYLVGNIAEHKRVSNISGFSHQEVEDNNRIPELIILDVTHRCNLRCNICEIAKDEPGIELATDEIKNIIEQSVRWGVKDLALSGGEALLREDIFEILEFVRERKYNIGILTNGILLDEDFTKKLLPYLVSKTVSLVISLDAMSADIHDDIRGSKGCFQKTAEALKRLSDLKKIYPELNFSTISIILNENLEELLPLVDFLKSLNVNSIQLQPLLANNLIMKERSNKAKYWIPPERLAVLDGIIDGLIDFKRQNQAFVRNSENNLCLTKKYFRGSLSSFDVRCSYGCRTMLIANNGTATTCFDRYGDARKKSLRAIYASMEAGKARERASNCRNPCLLPCFCD
ncbi:MAG TPA: hypothetical protein DCL49_05795 [Candidatus Omnitrophica bacterium]|nr:hypothetical protein [Candidatus Omnitrophota bacterium]